MICFRESIVRKAWMPSSRRWNNAVAGILLGVVAGFSGCIVWNRSSNYPRIVGHEFVTRRNLYLNKMHEFQYDFVPYELSTVPGYGGPKISDFVEPVPAGSRIHFVDAKYKSNIDAGFDFLIANLYLPGQSKPIQFEFMMGEPENADSFDRMFTQVK